MRYILALAFAFMLSGCTVYLPDMSSKPTTVETPIATPVVEQPNITVNVPEAPPPKVTVNIPEMDIPEFKTYDDTKLIETLNKITQRLDVLELDEDDPVYCLVHPIPDAFLTRIDGNLYRSDLTPQRFMEALIEKEMAMVEFMRLLGEDIDACNTIFKYGSSD